MKHFLLIPLFLLVSCGGNTTLDYRSNLEILCNEDDYKVLGKMSSGLLTDSLFYFRQNSLIFKQYWENGCLLATEYNDNDHFRTLQYISQLVDSTRHLRYLIYYTDKQDTSFKVYPYDQYITHFYYKVKKHDVVKFKADEPTIINILNIPQEICTIAVSGGIVKRISDGFSITPTKHKGDTLRVYYYFRSTELPHDCESFIIE